jgi:NAD(P)-dependent dehydrogenase (short-subunit alcohol dehydrogenase family)
MSRRFLDRSVLVTDAGSRIGRAAALLFAEEGGRFVVVDQNEADAQATASLIQDAGDEALAVGADISPGAGCRATVEHALAAYGN